MKKVTCKTEDEVNLIITELQSENPDLSDDLIINSISSCCLVNSANSQEEFIDCVKERIRILRLM